MWTQLLFLALAWAATTTLSLGAEEESQPQRGRIVGGSDASVGDFPYQLSLQLNGSHVCGASVVSDVAALTTASCVDALEAREVSLRAGSHVLGEGGVVHQAAKIVKHPNYDWWIFDFDVAVVFVETPFQFSDVLQPVALAPNGTVPEQDELLLVAGWGARSNPDSGVALSPTLQQVSVPVVPNRNCSEAYGVWISPRMVCAGVQGKDICVGDGGGAAVVVGDAGQETLQVGIASWNWGCDQPGLPGVYASVGYLRPWIDEVLLAGL